MATHRPRSLTDFRKLGKGKLGGRSAREAKALHDRRQARKTVDPQYNTTAERMLAKAVTIPLGLYGAQLENEIRDQYTQRKNWEFREPIATRFPRVGGTVRTNNKGRYSSRCRYTHYTYTTLITSCGLVVSARVAVFFFGNDPMRVIRAPRGYSWGTDKNGLRLIASNGADFHPTAADIVMYPVRVLCGMLRENEKTRKQQEQEAKAKSKQERDAVRRAEREGAMICVRDSLKAGNCYAGTTTWATRHGLDPARHYRPSDVLALANGDTHKVALVVTVALRRHRVEMERGYCDMSDHVK